MDGGWANSFVKIPFRYLVLFQMAVGAVIAAIASLFMPVALGLLLMALAVLSSFAGGMVAWLVARDQLKQAGMRW